VAGSCAWRSTGYPSSSHASRPRQTYEGTDRQCRGHILSVLREATSPVTQHELDGAWQDVDQCRRALTSLIDDGLVTGEPRTGFRLPD
jgi:A/G-specific adenine glycosylase